MLQKMKELTEKQLTDKAERYCIQAERCSSEVRKKLELWGALEDVTEQILEHLVRERYVDEERFAVAFARDKMRYNRWGRVKIRHALREKEVSGEQIREGLARLDEEEYRDILLKTLRDKWPQVKGRNDYECRQKLIRFALGRGFEMQEVTALLPLVGCGEDDDEI